MDPHNQVSNSKEIVQTLTYMGTTHMVGLLLLSYPLLQVYGLPNALIVSIAFI